MSSLKNKFTSECSAIEENSCTYLIYLSVIKTISKVTSSASAIFTPMKLDFPNLVIESKINKVWPRMDLWNLRITIIADVKILHSWTFYITLELAQKKLKCDLT